MNNAMFYAWMSQASYLYFNNSQSSLNDSELTKLLQNDDWKPQEDGEENPRLDKYFATKQAEMFTVNYSFVSHQENSYSGMSSTVFQSKEDGSYTFAMRGTEFPSFDLVEDGVGVVLAGKAKAQLVDAFHYYKKLTTPEGEAIDYSDTEREIISKLLLGNTWTGVGLISSAEAAEVYIINTLSQDTGLGEIEKGATINFTGHSLGGHLAYSLAEMVYTSCEGRYEIGDIMTYNAPGQNALSFEILNWIGVDTSSQAGFIGGKHIAFYAEQGANITAGLGQVVGTSEPVFIESDPSILAQFSVDNHSITKLSDTLSVYNIFAKLDKDFYWDTSANNIDNTLPVLNKILENSTGLNYQRGLENILDKLDKLLAPANADITPTDDKESFYQKVQRLTEKALEVKHSSFTEIEILDNMIISHKQPYKTKALLIVMP
ncbi:MAG: hypothetical protein IJR46_07165 [Neisseriaceae bacterium]|nr:hypothetical protein [Neisseriaceae bacterium]